MMRPPIADHILARMLNVDIEDVRALKALCRESHPRGGQRLGFCACGSQGAGSPACNALGALMWTADAHHRMTK